MADFQKNYLSLLPAFQVGFTIAPKPDTVLQEMLAMGLDKFLDELTEISGRAAKEFSLEKVGLKPSIEAIVLILLCISKYCQRDSRAKTQSWRGGQGTFILK